MSTRCTLLVNLWNLAEGRSRLMAEVSAVDVEFASVPSSGDRIRAGSLGPALESFMALPTVDRVEHAPVLDVVAGSRTARTVVVVNMALLRELEPSELDRICDDGWTVITHDA